MVLMEKETLPYSITTPCNGRPIPHGELWYRTFRYTRSRRRNGAFSLGGGLVAGPSGRGRGGRFAQSRVRDVVRASACAFMIRRRRRRD